MKRIISVLAVAALMAVMSVAMAAPAFADPSDPPRCHGQFNKLAHQLIGVTPADAVDQNPILENAGNWNKEVQEGDAHIRVPLDEETDLLISCEDV